MLEQIAVVSGYFNPLHVGHLRLMEDAKEGADRLVVIVNNDAQQVAKKGMLITPEDERLRIVSALRIVDEAFIAVDSGPGVGDSLQHVRMQHPAARIIFCNGGDRRATEEIPEAEALAAREAAIELRFGVGGTDKHDSSARILETIKEYARAELSREGNPPAGRSPPDDVTPAT
jgi:glycerol-3-phosphate cytidylyltransferase/D-beta-D-heptose 7-phosphate kinase/D-beta-D-heptose 1-phosphate adenosyltransferase